MKRLLFFVFAMGLSFNVVSEEHPTTPNNLSYSEELNLWKDNYKKSTEEHTKVIEKYDSIIKELKDERKNHQDFVESLYKRVTGVLGVVFSVAIAIFTFLGFRTYKNIEESVEKAREQAFRKLAKKLNTHPRVLEEVIKEKSVEISLKKEYHIFILKLLDDDGKAQKMENILFSFGFENVQVVGEVQVANLSKQSVIVLFNKLSDDTLKSQIKASNCAILGFGRERDIAQTDLKEYVSNSEYNTCSSFATLYHNLLSLLYYKKELNKEL